VGFKEDIEEIKGHINDLHESVARMEKSWVKMETNVWWLKWIALAIFAERVIDKLF